jgi:MoaA/NifB/PqqE/SkfB family radical SAM enzyme
MPQRDMPLERLEDILRGLSGLRHVELQGEGEPMLHPQFFEMAEMIRRLHSLVKISLITNGSLLSAENFERILEVGFHKMMVSIESPDPETFAEIRGGKLSKVIDGIRMLIVARDERHGARDKRLGAREGTPHAPREDGHHAERDEYTGPAVGFAITVLRSTMHELPRLLDLYDELGLDGGITLQPLQTMPVYTQHYGPEMHVQMLTPADRRQFQEELRHNPRVRDFFSRRSAAIGFYDDLFAGWHPRSGECPWLARGLYVAYNGTATGCCYIKDTARDGFGELSPATIEQVATNREAMQSELRSGRIPGPCTNCATAQAIVAARRDPRRVNE